VRKLAIAATSVLAAFTLARPAVASVWLRTAADTAKEIEQLYAGVTFAR
jgi:hypothetical protein